MAGNKRTRGLDITTRNTLNAIEAALASVPTKSIRADEFTIETYVAHVEAAGDHRTLDGHRSRMRRLVEEGKFKTRKVTVNGRECNAYSCA